MPSLCINPSILKGTIAIPPSKSHTLRALLFGMMGKSKTIVRHYLDSQDTLSMINAIRMLGSKVILFPDRLEIEPGFQSAENVIDAGNSGIVFRFIGALAALLPTYTVITGDHSIRNNRPIKPLLEGLKHLGAFAETAKGNAYAPIIIKGPIKPQKAHLLGTDSQPVSALLIAAAFLEGTTTIHVQDPGEKPWIDLTLSWLDRLGISYENQNYSRYLVKGPTSYPGFDITIPADLSTLAYPLVAALITGSELTLCHANPDDSQGDKQVIEVLKRMGANIEWKDSTLIVRKGSRLRGCTIDVNDFIDGITILAVVGCFAEGTTKIVNGANARNKESDRIHAITTELKKMGAQIEEQEDGLTIQGAPLHGAYVMSYSDHRVALSLAVAALGSQGETIIDNTECIAKTYPTFVPDFNAINAKINE